MCGYFGFVCGCEYVAFIFESFTCHLGLYEDGNNNNNNSNNRQVPLGRKYQSLTHNHLHTYPPSPIIQGNHTTISHHPTRGLALHGINECKQVQMGVDGCTLVRWGAGVTHGEIQIWNLCVYSLSNTVAIIPADFLFFLQLSCMSNLQFVSLSPLFSCPSVSLCLCCFC